MTGRTYRVPIRVQEGVLKGVESYIARGARAEDADALNIARLLTAGAPVDIGVASTIHGFFDTGWRLSVEKERLAPLYGGEEGRSWATRCVVACGLVAAAAEGEYWYDPDELTDLMTMTPEDADLLMAYGADEEELLAAATEPVSPEEEVVVPGVEEIEEGPVESEVESVPLPGMLMLSEEDVEDAAEESISVAAMREAIASASQAVLAAEAGAPPAGPAAEAPAAAPEAPAEGGEVHHAARQLRDYHGRFAKKGARVQGTGGNLGWVKGSDGEGNAIITLDDGSETTIDPKEMRVVTAEGRGRLDPNPQVVDDPGARLEAYEAWAREQLGGATA